MARIALLHPQCVRLGGAIKMALLTTHALQDMGHEVTLYTFERSDVCFPELQKGLNIHVWQAKPKIRSILGLAWYLRHVDIIVANNPPMQIVAALSKLFSTLFIRGKSQSRQTKKMSTIWWHHHVPWYFQPLVENTREQSTKHKEKRVDLIIKSFFERRCIIPFIDEMITTSQYVGDCLRDYCGREAQVIHPVIAITSPTFKGGGGVSESHSEYNHNESGGLQHEQIQDPIFPLNFSSPVTRPLLSTGDKYPRNQTPTFNSIGVAPGKGHWGIGELRNCGTGAHATVPVPLSRGENSQNEQGGLEQNQEKSGYAEYTYPANTLLADFSSQMSREMTRAEQRLWFEVLANKKTGYKWVKQKIIGNFIVDFYCHEKRLVIEVDGGVHQEQEEYDNERTQYLEKLGIRVIRFTNDFILGQTDQVRERILWEMEQIQDPNHQLSISSPLKGAQAALAPLERWTGEPEQITLFTHGRLEPGKGIDMIVRLWKNLKKNTIARPLPSTGNKYPHKQTPTFNSIGVAPLLDPFHQLNASIPLKGELRHWGTGTDHNLIKTDTVVGPPFKGGGGVSESHSEYNHNESGGLQQVHLIIFGTGSLEKELREQGIDVRPFDRESTFEELKSGKYGQAIGVYCSSIDAFGMAPLEAQMTGLSTVILDKGGARETIVSDMSGEGVGHLVESEEALFSMVEYFLEHKIFPKPLSIVNFSHTKDYFSPKRLTSDLLILMSKIGV